MFLALGAATFFYVSVAGVVALLQPWEELVHIPFATAVAFERAFGWPWLVRLMMLGVVLSLLKVFNGNFLAATRLLYAMGSREMLSTGLRNVHGAYQTPSTAILLVGGVTLLAALLGRAILVPITQVGSLTCALGWLGTCLAFYFGAGGKLTPTDRAIGIGGAAVAGLFVVIVAFGFGFYEWLVSAIWACLGTALWWRGRARLFLKRAEPATFNMQTPK